MDMAEVENVFVVIGVSVEFEENVECPVSGPLGNRMEEFRFVVIQTEIVLVFCHGQKVSIVAAIRVVRNSQYTIGRNGWDKNK